MRRSHKAKIAQFTSNRLKTLRKERKLSIEKLAEILDLIYGDEDSNKPIISVPTLKKYESNNNSLMGMSIKNLAMFADYYDVSSDYLLGISDIRSLEDQASLTSFGMSSQVIKYLIVNNEFRYDLEEDDETMVNGDGTVKLRLDNISIINELILSGKLNRALSNLRYLRSLRRSRTITKEIETNRTNELVNDTLTLSGSQLGKYLIDQMISEIVTCFRETIEKAFEED